MNSRRFDIKSVELCGLAAKAGQRECLRVRSRRNDKPFIFLQFRHINSKLLGAMNVHHCITRIRYVGLPTLLVYLEAIGTELLAANVADALQRLMYTFVVVDGVCDSVAESGLDGLRSRVVLTLCKLTVQ